MSPLPPFDSTASSPETVELLRALVRFEKPQVALELGTYKGHAALAIGKALKDNGRGNLYTCDPVDHGVRELVREYGLEEYVNFRLEPAFALLDKMVDNQVGAGFVYIDHSGGTRLPAFEKALGILRPGGLVVVDDMGPSSPWKDGLGGATKELLRRELTMVLEGERGLGIYRSPAP